MEFLKFIFSNFWVFCGFVILIYSICSGITMIISSIIAAITGSDVVINIFSHNGDSKEESE